MRLKADQRVAILLHDGIRGTQGKTGLALLRYSEAPIVAVIDRQCAGESLSALTGIPRDVPIVATVAQALTYTPDVLAIGIAPAGGVAAGQASCCSRIINYQWFTYAIGNSSRTTK